MIRPVFQQVAEHLAGVLADKLGYTDYQVGGDHPLL